MLRENPVDLERVHCLGKVPYATYKKVLQVSAVHIYLTYPFVMSWSLQEAMASGCLIVASDTAPVREVIRGGENGLLVDFRNSTAIAEKVFAALVQPLRFQLVRLAAHRDVQEYAFESGISQYLRLLEVILRVGCIFLLFLQMFFSAAQP